MHFKHKEALLYILEIKNISDSCAKVSYLAFLLISGNFIRSNSALVFMSDSCRVNVLSLPIARSLHDISKLCNTIFVRIPAAVCQRSNPD